MPTGRRRPHEVRVGSLGTPTPIPDTAVRAAVHAVLAGERVRAAAVSVTHLSVQRMRALHRRAFGVDRATDVIAFGMRHGSQRVGDVYVCPSVAARAARDHGVPLKEELIRLVVHGTLHVLGYDHPADASRQRSPMWRRQERYVARLRHRASS